MVDVCGQDWLLSADRPVARPCWWTIQAFLKAPLTRRGSEKPIGRSLGIWKSVTRMCLVLVMDKVF